MKKNGVKKTNRESKLPLENKRICVLEGRQKFNKNSQVTYK